MSNFFHGVRTEREKRINTTPIVAASGISFVAGTAPVHTASNAPKSGCVNEPFLGGNFNNTERALGYGDDWQKYDLCEVMYSHFYNYATAPVIFVNVLDPEKHKKTTAAKPYDIIDRRVILPFEAIKSTVRVTTPAAVLDTDYALFYHKNTLILEILDGGSIPSTATTLTVGFDEVEPSMVTAADIIGGYDIADRKRRGLELIESVFPKFGLTPDNCLCPNWSHKPEVAAVMAAKMDGKFRETLPTILSAKSVHFSNDSSVYYNVKHVSAGALERRLSTLSEFSLTFTCSPFRHLRKAKQELASVGGSAVEQGELDDFIAPITLTSSGNVANIGTVYSFPKITVYGTGSRTLTVNGRAVILNILQGNLTLDSELKLCYFGNVAQNQNMQGEFPVLEVGSNAITLGSGISRVEIEGRWRSL